jgi:gamma-glutamyltranspeptidase / glutathione hydrolase
VAHFENAAVCSPLTLASETGVAVLRDGGNAADAAIATNLMLAVAYPHMCGVGGDLFAQVWADGQLVGLNSSGGLPAGAELPPGGVPERGIGAVTIPGAPAGWKALAARFGTRSLKELATPAASLARSGVPRSPGLTKVTEWYRWLLEQNEDAKRIYLADTLVEEDLADTLECLDEFYEGAVTLNAPAPCTPEDFAAHQVEWVEPMSAPFAGVDVYEMPPNSRGYLALEALRVMEPLDGLTPGDAEWHLRLIRAIRRAAYGGDTIYLCAVDSDGMAVSLNQSLYMGFGSGFVVPGTGVLLHNRGAYHTKESYRGGAKPVHTLSPAMALQDGKPKLVVGTMGGDAQIQIHLQLLTRILVAGQSVEDAIAAPRWNATLDTLLVEQGLPELPDSQLITDMPDQFGHAHCIQVTDSGLEAAADPRADGIPVGY